MYQVSTAVLASGCLEKVIADVGDEMECGLKRHLPKGYGTLAALPERYAELVRHTFLDYQATETWLDNPCVMSRAEGVYYWDVNGKKYMDAISGIYCASLGHRHPTLIAALLRQAERLTLS